MAWSTPAQLTGSLVRIQRAKSFIQELEGALAEFEAALFRSIEFKGSDTKESVEIKTNFSRPHAELLPTASAITGDAVNNMRSALDYLVYELAKHNEGRVITGTQFVIAQNPNEFEHQRNTRLRGLSPRQVDIIRNVQPFQGVTWSQILAEISNQDKHRELVEIDDDMFELIIRGYAETMKEDPECEGVPTKLVTTSKGKLVFQGKISNVLIMGNIPALEALNDMHKNVSETVRQFYGDFRTGQAH